MENTNMHTDPATVDPATVVHSSSLDERACVGLITKRVYRLHSGRLGAGSPAPIVREAVYRELGEDDVSLVTDSDLYGLQKPTTDILLAGSAFSHHGSVSELRTALIAGAARKSVLVTGDRVLRVGVDGTLSASAPQPFERMRLGWHRAYGGRDLGTEQARHNQGRTRSRTSPPSLEEVLEHASIAYPRNRQGRGFFVDRERRRLDGVPLPNLSDPEDPIELKRLLAVDPCDWIDRPMPAGYGPIGALTFPRCFRYGLGIVCSRRTLPVREIALGALRGHEVDALEEPRGADAHAFNCAPPGLATTRLFGGERIELFNLHRSAARFTFELPAERPRLVIEPPNAGSFELEAKLATVFIEPDEDRVTLTWAGATAAAGIYTPEACAQMRHAAIWN